MRAARFLVVGFGGFLVQVGALWVLTALGGWSWLPATAVAVELAVVHNFVWHERWTWGERRADRGARCVRFAQFNLATGGLSLAGNIVLTGAFVTLLRLPVVVANPLAVVTLSVANFVVSDRWVFAAALLLVPAPLAAAPSPETLQAWQAYVSRTEARLQRTREMGMAFTSEVTAEGASIAVPNGTISDWRGAVFIRGLTLDRLLHGLQHPGTPPPQEDVVSSRVLSRGDHSLRVAIRLVRKTVVTVSYDTEHDMTFHRWSPTLATARSVATRIDEVGGGDHGFLWRLHSYWRYQERDGGVLVELESLTLSRDVPSLLRAIASPLVRHVARDSMTRTLDALRRYYS
jgi:putative flippase GtrA